jgi:nucleolar complex protein 3
VPAKRRKVAPPTGVSIKPTKSARVKGKERAFERTTIDIPRGDHDSENSELDDEDIRAIDEFGAGASFLQTLDEKGISRCVLLHLNNN